MARIFAVDDVPKALRDSLGKALRPEDEAVLLPSADLDATSGKYENVVFRLDATEKDVPHTVFSPAWGAGVSAIKVSGVWVDRILADAQHRQKCLAKLRDVIESQTADPERQRGPAHRRRRERPRPCGVDRGLRRNRVLRGALLGRALVRARADAARARPVPLHQLPGRQGGRGAGGVTSSTRAS